MTITSGSIQTSPGLMQTVGVIGLQLQLLKVHQMQQGRPLGVSGTCCHISGPLDPECPCWLRAGLLGVVGGDTSKWPLFPGRGCQVLQLRH